MLTLSFLQFLRLHSDTHSGRITHTPVAEVKHGNSLRLKLYRRLCLDLTEWAELVVLPWSPAPGLQRQTQQAKACTGHRPRIRQNTQNSQETHKSDCRVTALSTESRLRPLNHKSNCRVTFGRSDSLKNGRVAGQTANRGPSVDAVLKTAESLF